MTIGTSTVWRPGVRGLTARFVRCVVAQVPGGPSKWAPASPNGICTGSPWGDVELAFRGLVGNVAPVSPTSRVCGSRPSGTWNMRPGPTGGSRNWRAWMAGREDSTAARLVSGNQRNRGVRCSGICATGGLTPWRWTVTDGPWGIGTALGEPQPTAAAQRCWIHRILNGLDVMPKQDPPRPQRCYARCHMRRAGPSVNGYGHRSVDDTARSHQRPSRVWATSGTGGGPQRSSFQTNSGGICA